MKKLLYLSDLYNFFVSQNKSVKFNSKDEDKTIVVHVDEPFTYSKSEDDDLNLYCPIRLCHTEKNVNQTFISEKAMKSAIPSAYNMPILGYIYNDGEKDVFASHEFFINDDGETVYEEVPVGTIPESAKLELVYDEEMNKTYVDGTGIIWKTYSKAAEIIEREQKLAVSVELFVDELSYDSKEKVLCIDKFRFSGVTILQEDRDTGEEVKPGMVGANISIADFSAENNSVFSQNEKVIKLLSELNEKLDGLNIDNSSRKEETEDLMKKKFEKEVTEEEIKDSPSTEVFDEEPDGEGGDDPNNVDYYEDPQDGEGGDAPTGNDNPSGDNPSSGDTPATNDDPTPSGGDNPTPSGGNDPAPSGGDDPAPSGDGDDDDSGDNELTIPLGQRDDDDTAGGSKKSYSVSVTNGDITKQFSVSLQDKISALYNLVNDTYCEQDGVYYDVEVFDEDKYIIMSSWWGGDAYKQSYKVKKDVYSLVGDRVRVKAVWCTEDEEKALDSMRSNYSSIVDELASFKAEPEKEAVLAEECYAQIADTDAFKELSKKENHFSMSVDEVRAEADKQLLEYAKGHKIEFSANEEKKPVGTKRVGNPLKKAAPGSGRYGSLFS